jgi:DNA-binding transcriptional regulator PaaX
MRFEKKYPVPLSELLLTPVVFRFNSPELADLPHASAAGMRDLAEFAGHAPGAIRTAMSRLRASKLVETQEDERGVTRYQLAGMARSISHTVRDRPLRPEGFLLAIFSFSSEDVRERQVVREALKLHGFQKLAQNVYINGQIDTAEIEALLARERLTEHVYFFRGQQSDDPVIRKRITALFDLPKRRASLQQFHRDLLAYLAAPDLDDTTFARRFFYAGPVHYRITFIEEPPLSARFLPPDYPLEALERLLPELGSARAGALARYFRTANV